MCPAVLSVDAFIKALQQTCDRDVKHFADPQKRCHSDGSAGFNLLPVSRGEAKRDHVFLAVTLGLPKHANRAAQPGKEFRLIWHLRVCRVPRAETPRAD